MYTVRGIMVEHHAMAYAPMPTAGVSNRGLGPDITISQVGLPTSSQSPHVSHFNAIDGNFDPSWLPSPQIRLVFLITEKQPSVCL